MAAKQRFGGTVAASWHIAKKMDRNGDGLSLQVLVASSSYFPNDPGRQDQKNCPLETIWDTTWNISVS
jgi:hypothetical protein